MFGPDFFPLAGNGAPMARKAYDYALDLLSARGYTVRNLRRKLVQKEFEADEVNAAIERLLNAGLLDDGKYAREYVRQKLTSGGSSVRRVRLDLIKRGVAGEEINSAIEAVVQEEPVDIARSIDAAVKKKLASMGSLDPDVKRRRLFGFLARRGFEIADIRRSLDENLIADE